jgi:branched-subunit amino acid aminotransferase/4-amino-4-deoxychorismate lyase
MTMARASWLAGEFYEGAVPLFDGFDEGLLVGDGCFESFAIDARPAPWLVLHERRLRWGAGRIGLVLPEHPPLEPLLRELLLRAGLEKARARLTLLGPASGELSIQAGCRLLVTVRELPADFEEKRRAGIRLRTSSLRFGVDDPCAAVKSMSRALLTLAHRDALAHGAEDALLLGEHEELRECTRWSVFVQPQRGPWLTPTLTGAFLPGVARSRVLERLAELGQGCAQRTVRSSEIDADTAMFVTNAVYGAVPVRSLDGVELLPPKDWSGSCPCS